MPKKIYQHLSAPPLQSKMKKKKKTENEIKY